MPDGAQRVAAVILAAGDSSRLGEAKQLVEFRGESLVRRSARAAIECGASMAIVVLGARAALVRDAIGDLPGVRSVINERWAEGLASSLAAGMREVVRHDPGCDGVLIATSDQPLVDHLALRTLLDAFDDDNRVVAAEYEGTIGVPALIGREYFGALESLTGDSGAGKWLRSKGVDVRRVPMPNAGMDVDEAKDLTRLAELV